jgi:hypothetical protein
MEEGDVTVIVSMIIEISKDYNKDDVKNALLDEFSDHALKDGRKGFFHPENFKPGSCLYLSKIVWHAMKVGGVNSVQVTEFNRLNDRVPADGVIKFAPLEKFSIELSIIMK